MASGPQQLRVAVVGAGASGLAAIKCCLDEGITPMCFERTGHIGGLWHYTDQPVDGRTCVMKSTVINSSKELMCYSDFPMPAHFPNFLHNSQVLEYFNLYVDNFGLRRHIRHNTEVMNIKKTSDFSTTGLWEIRYRDINTGEENSDIFDGVLVCSGHKGKKYDPMFPTLKEFKGQVLHTNEYRVPASFADKTVLIIGIGNSAGDCASELSREAKQVFLSTRRGTWVVKRIGKRGYPMDMNYLKRIPRWLKKSFPFLHGFMEKRMERQINSDFDHELYSIRPTGGVTKYQFMINDDLPNRISTGSIKVKDDVKRFTEHGAEFVDGSREGDIDVVILATGYTLSIPFLDKEVLEVKDSNVNLYKLTYIPGLAHNTLAVIGLFQQLGALMPMAEMQCRLATRVLKGLITLPSSEEMWKEIRDRENTTAKEFLPSKRYNIVVDYVEFMDEISQLVGCYPALMTLLRKDPKMAFEVLFGPLYPYQYRLCGPGKWSGARDAILTAMERIELPFRTRRVPTASSSPSNKPVQDLQYLLVFLILVSITSLAFALL